MKVSFDFNVVDSRLLIKTISDECDNLEKYAGGDVFVEMPESWDYAAVHPDLLSLVAILIVHPFVGSILDVELPCSERFALACAKHLPYKCIFQSGIVSARSKGSVPSISFSGGVDSTASLAVMPRNVELFFMDRLAAKGSECKSMYVKDSAHIACGLVAEMGFNVFKIKSNLEFIRKPIGFPVDYANGIPAILMADLRNLSCVAWGTVAESAYGVGHARYADFAGRQNFTRWGGMLEAVGLDFVVPVAGLSEVCTSKIVQYSIYSNVAQSCIRGKKDEPCLNCFKCCRKVLLDSALSGSPISAVFFESLMAFNGSDKYMLSTPIKHESVFKWAMERVCVTGESKLYDAFKSRLGINCNSVDWSGSWYPGSEKFISDEFRRVVRENILEFVPVMTAEYIESFESWRVDPADKKIALAVDVLSVELLKVLSRKYPKKYIVPSVFPLIYGKVVSFVNSIFGSYK